MEEKKMNRPVRVVLGGLLLVAVAAGGATVGVIAGRGLTSADATTVAAEPGNEGVPVAFGVNQFGQTFGEYGIGLRDDPGANPELIRVVGLEGVEGYAYTTEVFGTPAGSPEEATRMGEETLAEKEVSVYKEDGRTVIGVYIANAGY